MDCERVPPGSTTTRYDALVDAAGGSINIYIARRYFNLTPDQWNGLPWWETRALIEGLRAEGVLKDPNKNDDDNGPITEPGRKPGPVIDMTGPLPGPIKGFTTRRAG